MKKLLITTGFVLSFFVLGQSVRAQSINDTGPNSNNTVNQEQNTTCTVTNNNQVEVENNNQQESTTGETHNNNNTNSSNSTTGSANNNSTTDTDISIDNNEDCVPVASSEERPVGGMGGGAPIVAQASVPQVKITPVGGVGAGGFKLADAVRQLVVLGGSLGLLYFGFRRLSVPQK